MYLLLITGAWAGGASLVLPPGEDPAAWRGSAALAGLDVGDTAASRAVTMERTPGGWLLVARDGQGRQRAVRIATPTDARAREDAAWLAASLLRSLPAPPTAEGASQGTLAVPAPGEAVRSTRASGPPPGHGPVAAAARVAPAVRPPATPASEVRPSPEATEAAPGAPAPTSTTLPIAAVAAPPVSPTTPSAATAPLAAPPVSPTTPIAAAAPPPVPATTPGAATAPLAAPPVSPTTLGAAAAPPPVPATTPIAAAAPPPVPATTPIAAAAPPPTAAPAPALGFSIELGLAFTWNPDLALGEGIRASVGLHTDGPWVVGIAVRGIAPRRLDGVPGGGDVTSFDADLVGGWAPDGVLAPVLRACGGVSARVFTQEGEPRATFPVPALGGSAGVRWRLAPAVAVGAEVELRGDLGRTTVRVGDGPAESLSPWELGASLSLVMAIR